MVASFGDDLAWGQTEAIMRPYRPPPEDVTAGHAQRPGVGAAFIPAEQQVADALSLFS
jgi:hypothetical protein